MNTITLNIVEPGSGPTPAPVVPNTGLFTSGIGGPEATAIGAVLILTIAAIVVTILYRKQKKSGKVTKLVHLVDSTKAILKSKKRITAGLSAIALLASAGTLTTLLANAGKSNTNAIEEDGLTLDVTGGDITIEVGDEPVFAVAEVKATVKEATQAGYTLTAYTDNTDLVSTTNPDNSIPMIAVEGDELEALTANTYGLALGNEPTSKDEAVYTTLSIDSEEPTILKSMPEYIPTEAEDTTTIYYAFYITPDIPYGTYTNDSEVYYNATINTTPVTFDGNGLYFNNEEQQTTTNEVEYIAVPEEGKEYNVNQIISGEYKEPSQDLPYNFLGWSTDKNATVPTYETEEKIAEFLPILPNTPLTLYAVWQKATTITFDNNGGAGEMDKQTIIAGETNNLNPNTFTREGYHFTGWNTEATPTEQTPGTPYADKAEYTAPLNKSQNLILYAQWEEDILYMQDVATWGSTLTQGNEITVVDSRDGTEYTVARLADNNIWMTQNLDFDITNKGADLNSTNTDVPQDWEDAGKLTNTYSTGTTTWNYSFTAPESYDPGDLYWNGAFIYDKETCEANDGWWYKPQYQPGECRDANPTASIGDIHYHIGNYYNWTAAVAMSDSSRYTSDGTDVDQSICPAGWRLPNLSENKSYQNLVDTLSLSAGTGGNIQNSPVYFVYGGYWRGESLIMGNYGYYWSSVVDYNNGAYLLGFNVNGNLNPQSSTNRSDGRSVRCVAR